MFLKYCDFRFFFVSFAIGVLYIYLSDEHKKVIVLYPNPDNLEKYTYLDKTDNCFNYELDEVDCPTDVNSRVDVEVSY